MLPVELSVPENASYVIDDVTSYGLGSNTGGSYLVGKVRAFDPDTVKNDALSYYQVHSFFWILQ
jgi:hypothetical protein